MFCGNNDKIIKLIAFLNSVVAITAEIVYPMQKPLYNIIPNKIGIPIIVHPINQISITTIIFCFKQLFSNIPLSIESPCFIKDCIFSIDEVIFIAFSPSALFINNIPYTNANN